MNCPAEAPEQGYYDTCGGMVDKLDEAGDITYVDTQWSVIYQLNAIVFLVHTILTGLLCIGTIFPPFLICGGCGHCYSMCAYLASVIVTGVFRFREVGAGCADNRDVITNLDGDTFHEMGNLIQDLFISQCALYFFYSVCIGVAIQISIMGAASVYGSMLK